MKRILARNMAWNYAGMAATMVAGFITAPFLLNELGKGTYGLWLLIGSFTGYFGLLDFGVRGSVGRFVAFHHARDDNASLNNALSTALTLLFIPALLAALGTIAAQPLFFHLFDVPADQIDTARIALLLVGLNLALTFVLGPFDGVLWAFQRFDLINGIDLIGLLARTTLMFYLIAAGHGLVALAGLSIATTLATGMAKLWAAHRVYPALRIRVFRLARDQVPSLMNFSFWYFLLSLCRMLTGQLNRLLIGHWLSVAAVTPFGIAASLVSYGTQLLVAATGVLTPLATSLHAGAKQAQQERLFLTGGKVCAYYAFSLLGWYLTLGRAFLLLWMGREVVGAFDVLVALAIGEALPLSQSTTGNMLLGMARHRGLALLSALEALLVVVLASVLIDRYGLTGAAVAVAVPAGICRGLCVAFFGSKAIGVSFGEYLRSAFIPGLLHSAVPVGLLWSAVYVHTPQTRLELLGYIAAFGAVWCVVGAYLLNLLHLSPRREPDGTALEVAGSAEARAD